MRCDSLEGLERFSPLQTILYQLQKTNSHQLYSPVPNTMTSSIRPTLHVEYEFKPTYLEIVETYNRQSPFFFG